MVLFQSVEELSQDGGLAAARGHLHGHLGGGGHRAAHHGAQEPSSVIQVQIAS